MRRMPFSYHCKCCTCNETSIPHHDSYFLIACIFWFSFGFHIHFYLIFLPANSKQFYFHIWNSECAIGYFWNQVVGECQQCQTGTYSDSPYADSCHSCPNYCLSPTTVRLQCGIGNTPLNKYFFCK